ncbi:hypothetical protein [Streptomyces sp. NBC_01361]|uniref:hypothetical protein n=1 Tax=Streptomyces sp. NBC_01361 TaxID=2903838 RepID=UPI002E314136|nr:hypothetical protein [Streptomyces sp. NBC_01361]
MGLDELELKRDTFLSMLQTQLNGVPLPVSEMTNFPGRWLDRLVLTAAEIRSRDEAPAGAPASTSTSQPLTNA